jgi:methylenetetrahydrofolate reductase (NADPH)
MKIKDILKQKDTGVSFEFFPPKTDQGKRNLAVKVQTLKKYHPLYVSMTYGAGGTNQQHTKEAVYMLLQEEELVVMPHLTCIGASKDYIRELLQEYKTKGIENIMALRGDLPRGCPKHEVHSGDFCYAVDLVKFIKQCGDFCVGVAVYPEGHIETVSLDEDLKYTQQKIDAGADFAVTQMFFDNTYYYDFLQRIRKKGINIPVLPGILPLTNIEKVKEFTSICRTTIPSDIEKEMLRFSDSPLDMEKVGIEFTIKQCRDLIENGVGQLHFFTLNKKETITTILDAVL